MNIGKFKNLLLASAVLLFSISSLTYLVKERKYIVENIKQFTSNKKYDSDYQENEKHKFWAKNLLSGGYILFFRHAERDIWSDVQMYDALESQLQGKNSNSYRFAENEYFEDAVCLNKKGKIQAKAMGEVIKYSQLPIGYVVSSPSCRARQTADIAFGGYDELEKKLVHKGPFTDVGDRPAYLENYILNLPRFKDKNVIISAHASIIGTHLFPGDKSLGQGGFHVLSINNNNKLVLEHDFYNFKSFSKQFFIRNHN